MSNNKNAFKRMARSLPSLYRPEVNTMIGGLLKAWGVSDDEIHIQLQNTKDQLFTETASERFLDRLGNNVGVNRSSDIGIEDNSFRQLVPVMSFYPKQVRKTIVALLDVFWGPGFTRANVNSGNTETYNFGPAIGLTGTMNFINGQAVIKGTGTLFLTEVQIGDYIKPSAFSGTTYAKVNNIIDDTTLELSLPWSSQIAVGSTATKGLIKDLEYTVDDSVTRTIRFKPNAFDDLTSVTIAELINYINTQVEHNQYITASKTIDLFTGSKLNIRTNTPGLQGSIKINGGTANSALLLNFTTDKQTELKANVFEVNPNEVIVKIPSSVPVLRRSLKGSLHIKETKTRISSSEELFDFNSLGATSNLTVTVDGSPFVINFTHSSDFVDSTKATASEVVAAINKQLVPLIAFEDTSGASRKVGLNTSEGAMEYQVTGGTANTLLQFDTSLQQDPDIIQTNYPASYLFDPTGQLFTVTGTATTLVNEIPEGTVQSAITLTDSSSFPNVPGKVLFDFGRREQEGPISYISRPNNSTLLIDASHVFEKTHSPGRLINYIDNNPTIPRVTGEDYAVYVVGTEAARLAAEDMIRKLIASGVIIRFIIDYPEYLFICTCRDCGASESPDYKGSLTNVYSLNF